ncbi:GNAT family N-acetyltransferase [Candidatus Parcubacteria bacterium]|nr:GNAT family N-acetyltransferase [Candidatus Parcubacteria bacterium]
MEISKVTKNDFSDWVNLGVSLWPNHSRIELEEEFRDILHSDNEGAFVYKDESGRVIAFLNFAIRRDYVEGASTNPVGYIEGIYVKDEYRKRGIAKKLIEKTEEWFVQQGISEIGSDVEADNLLSQEFHKSIGFKEGKTLIHYLKKI